MNNIEKIRQEIERLKEENRNIRCQHNDKYCSGYDDAFNDLLAFIDSLPEDASCIYDTNKLTPTPSVNIEDVARVQFASHAHVFDRKRKAVFDWEQFKEVAGIFYGFGKRDSLPEEPVTTCNELEEAIKPDFTGCVLDSTKFALLGKAAGKSLLEPHIETMRRRIERKIAELPPAPEGYRYAWQVENIIKEGDAFTVTSNFVLKPINPEHDEQLKAKH